MDRHHSCDSLNCPSVWCGADKFRSQHNYLCQTTPPRRPRTRRPRASAAALCELRDEVAYKRLDGTARRGDGRLMDLNQTLTLRWASASLQRASQPEQCNSPPRQSSQSSADDGAMIPTWEQRERGDRRGVRVGDGARQWSMPSSDGAALNQPPSFRSFTVSSLARAPFRMRSSTSGALDNSRTSCRAVSRDQSRGVQPACAVSDEL